MNSTAESQKLEMARCLFSIIVMDENPNQLLKKLYWNACFWGIIIMILSIKTNWRVRDPSMSMVLDFKRGICLKRAVEVWVYHGW